MPTQDHKALTSCIEKGVGRLYLNRPQALNALNLEMIEYLYETLLKWRDDAAVEAVLITSHSEKAFCAGGDLRSVFEAHQKQDHAFLEALFRKEYTLNHMIRNYPKPYIAFIDGIAMGGGLGVSLHGDCAVVTDRAVLAMPEVNIGYFPDVGAGYFLNLSTLHKGFYLGLTGTHFSPKEAIEASIAQFYVSHDRLESAVAGLLDLPSKDAFSVRSYLGSLHENPGSSDLFARTAFLEPWLQLPDFSDFWQNLCQSTEEPALTMRAILEKRSPLAVVLTWYQLKRCRHQDFKTIMQYEFELSRAFINIPDFIEGIRSVIIDKDHKPMWQPQSIADVTPSMIDHAMHFMDAAPLAL